MSTQRAHLYETLQDEESYTDLNDNDVIHITRPSKIHRTCGGSYAWPLIFLLVPSLLLNIYVFGSWLQNGVGQLHSSLVFPQLVYCKQYLHEVENHLFITSLAPAEKALGYERKVFSRGLIDQISIYEQEPSKEVDKAWLDLYEFSGSTLPGQTKVPTFNETLEFVIRKGSRIQMLDVFHQLHCLDTIRKALHPQIYNHHVEYEHIMHCVNSIRQSLMCMADISVVSWEWNEQLNSLTESADNIHTCRNFAKLKEWALSSHFDRQFIVVV